MRTVVLTMTFCLTAGAAAAGPVERACNASDRQSATRTVCNCIGQVADQMLSNSDQRRAAKFFRDPDAAQKARSSDTRSAEAFWERYSRFGQVAETTCSG